MQEGRKPKATSCAACRKSKLKCQPSPTERVFPCPRCVRLGYTCEDPQKQPLVVTPEDRIAVLTRMLKRKFQHHTGRLDRGRVLYFFRAFGMMYRHRVNDVNYINWTTKKSTTYMNILRVLGEYLGMDPDDAIHPRFHSDGDDGVVIEGRLLKLTDRREDALHPFLLPFFLETSSTIGFVNLRGEPRFYVNESFGNTFFTAEYANRRVREDSVPPPDMMFEILHPEEQRRFDKSFHYFCFETEAPVTETSQIYKVQLKNGAVVTTLLRVRTAFEADGEYMGFAFSFTPLPLKPVYASAGRTSLGHVEVPCQHNPFDVFSTVVGVQGDDQEGRLLQGGRKRRAVRGVEGGESLSSQDEASAGGSLGGLVGEGKGESETYSEFDDELRELDSNALLWDALMGHDDAPVLGVDDLRALVQEQPETPSVGSGVEALAPSASSSSSLPLQPTLPMQASAMPVRPAVMTLEDMPLYFPGLNYTRPPPVPTVQSTWFQLQSQPPQQQQQQQRHQLHQQLHYQQQQLHHQQQMPPAQQPLEQPRLVMPLRQVSDEVSCEYVQYPQTVSQEQVQMPNSMLAQQQIQQRPQYAQMNPFK